VNKTPQYSKKKKTSDSIKEGLKEETKLISWYYPWIRNEDVGNLTLCDKPFPLLVKYTLLRNKESRV
jgi:hypothetical protein